MNKKSLTCIICPRGCLLSVWKEEGAWKVEGNSCERGKAYAITEMEDPRRTVTAVVRTTSDDLPYAPVRTDKPISRKLVDPLLKAIYACEVKAPFKTGDTVIANFEDTSVNVVLTRTDRQPSKTKDK